MAINSNDFANAYERNYSRTIRFLASKGVREDAAQEFAQYAWARAWERRHQLQCPTRLVQWVMTIAINGFLDSLRHSSREEPLKKDGYQVTTKSTTHFVAELLSHCKTYRSLLEAFYLWGYSTEEIAVSYDTSPLAIRVRLTRARAELRRALGHHHSDLCGGL